jgi:hypothetical protein
VGGHAAGEKISWYDVVARAQMCRVVVFAHYAIPASLDIPLKLNSNPTNDRFKPRVWNDGSGRLKFICFEPNFAAQPKDCAAVLPPQSTRGHIATVLPGIPLVATAPSTFPGCKDDTDELRNAAAGTNGAPQLRPLHAMLSGKQPAQQKSHFQGSPLPGQEQDTAGQDVPLSSTTLVDSSESAGSVARDAHRIKRQLWRPTPAQAVIEALLADDGVRAQSSLNSLGSEELPEAARSAARDVLASRNRCDNRHVRPLVTNDGEASLQDRDSEGVWRRSPHEGRGSQGDSELHTQNAEPSDTEETDNLLEDGSLACSDIEAAAAKGSGALKGNPVRKGAQAATRAIEIAKEEFRLQQEHAGKAGGTVDKVIEEIVSRVTVLSDAHGSCAGDASDDVMCAFPAVVQRSENEGLPVADGQVVEEISGPPGLPTSDPPQPS